MKKSFLTITFIASILAACNSNQSSNNQNTSATTQTETSSANENSVKNPSINLINPYLAIKDALFKDDGEAAAKAGAELASHLKSYDQSSLSTEQQKTFADIQPDILENAEHISENGDKIAHQREHFEMLSADMYDLVKSLGTPDTLYKTFCPMVNHNKGAYWLSATKEIQNPYLGQKMSTCGSIKETIK